MVQRRKTCRKLGLSGMALGAWLTWTEPASAQTSSLHRNGSLTNQPLTLENTSFTYVKLEPPRELKINDIITVVVDYKTQHLSVGNLQRRKRQNIQAELDNWVAFNNGNLVAAPFSNGAPKVNAQLNNQVQTQVQLNAGDTVKFRIAATIVDIRPNGNMVIEAHQHIEDNEDTYEQRLSGVVRREDVLPNNTVLSEDVAELHIEKSEAGHVRDGYKRGWFLRWMDQIGPF